mmetsp:Transcript_17480/g.61073  ORF Transcript_17480/g.61073 Transcript_17480/m.61073 type:complete len:930 (-) Transcript_17480:202-2991(-)
MQQSLDLAGDDVPTNEISAPDASAPAAVAVMVGESKAQQLHFTQGKWIVTHEGRLKMMHDESRRDKEWMSEFLPDMSSAAEQPVGKLTVCESQTVGIYHVSVVLDGTAPGFQLEAQSMSISHIDEGRRAQSPFDLGDKIVDVNGQAVTTFEEYTKATAVASTYSLGIRPLQAWKHHLWSYSRLANSLGDDMPISCIEFDTAEVVCNEDAGCVEVPLRRVGDVSKGLRWRWRLANGNVVGKLFAQLRRTGEVVFEAGAHKTTIEVDIPIDPTWNSESLCFLYLEGEEIGGSSATQQDGVRVLLGDNRQVSMYSLNVVSFPQGAYGKQPKLHKEIHDHFLCWKFIEHNYTEIPGETVRGVLYCFLPPVLFFCQQVIFELLVNCALADESTSNCQMYGVDWSVLRTMGGKAVKGMLIIVASAQVLFKALEHLIEVRTRMLRLGGKASLMLRANVFSTMLQLADSAMQSFDEGDVQKTLDTEVEAAVTGVWLQAFTMLRTLLSLLVKLIITVRIASTLRLSEALVIAACIPVMIVTVLLVFSKRRHKQLALRMKAFGLEKNWSAFVTMCSACSPLILMYKRGWFFTKQFQQCHARYNAAAYDAGVHHSWTMWTLRYLFVLISAVVIVFGGTAVRDYGLPIGSFLVLLRSVDGFGKDILDCTHLANSMVVGTAAVRKIADVLNAETRRQQRCFREYQLKVDVESETTVELRGVYYMYPGTQNGQSMAVAPIDLTLPSGNLICFPVGSMLGTEAKRDSLPGIHTLFSLIAGRLLPDGGKIRVPSRWRVIYIPVTPIIFDGTLMYNLMFSDRAQNMKAAWEVCRALGLSPGLIGRDDFDVGTNGHRLKFSDRVIISITRALMHEVDLLLISSALDVLGEVRAVKVLRFLRHYSENRGLPHQRVHAEVRHKKTVLYTSKFKMLQDQAKHHVERAVEV